MKTNQVYQSNILKLLSNEYIENQRIAGSILKETFKLLINNYKNLSLIKLSRLAEEYIIDSKAIPTFKNYKTFPEAVCLSLQSKNRKCILHGIPNDNFVEEEDILTIDFGVTYNKSIVDSARTFYNGKDKVIHKMIEQNHFALNESIKKVEVNQRVGVIGNEIFKIAKKSGFNVIDKYGGHAISDDVHSFPFIANKSEVNEGVHIYNNMSLAIEPIFCLNSNSTYIDSDKWSIIALSSSSHFEDTILIKDNKVENLTYF